MKHLIIFVSLFQLQLSLTSAQTACGAESNGAVCGAKFPCCSEFGVCSFSPLHCGGACQSAFSFSSSGPTASCFGDRPNIGRSCRSGFYDFTASTTWIINADAYTGDYKTADFTVDPAGMNNGNVIFGQSGGVMLKLTPSPQGWSPDSKGNYPAGLGGRLSSTSYLHYGTFWTRLTTAGIPGIVTAFISYSDDKDEIDWEVTGENNSKVQTNFFYRGNVDYTKSKSFLVSKSTDIQDYELMVKWTADSIEWFVDGTSVRVVKRADTCNSNGVCSFPSSPSRIQLAIWDGGAGGQGTRDWAGGRVPWSLSPTAGFNATYHYVGIQCSGDPKPTGPPTRPTGYGPPSLKEPPIPIAVPSVQGYTDALMHRIQSAYSP